MIILLFLDPANWSDINIVGAQFGKKKWFTEYERNDVHVRIYTNTHTHTFNITKCIAGCSRHPTTRARGHKINHEHVIRWQFFSRRYTVRLPTTSNFLVLNFTNCVAHPPHTSRPPVRTNARARNRYVNARLPNPSRSPRIWRAQVTAMLVKPYRAGVRYGHERPSGVQVLLVDVYNPNDVVVVYKTRIPYGETTFYRFRTKRRTAYVYILVL